MLLDIFNALVSIVNFIQMEWNHVLQFFSILGDSVSFIPKTLTYLPSFSVGFVSVAVSILFVRKIINR